jgi:hypothetical protein
MLHIIVKKSCHHPGDSARQVWFQRIIALQSQAYDLTVLLRASARGLLKVRPCLAGKMDSEYHCLENNVHHAGDPACHVRSLPRNHRPMGLPYF